MRPNPGRSGATPPPSFRNASQSSLLLGAPCRYSVGSTSPPPSGAGAVRQKTGSSSISPVCSLTDGKVAASIAVRRYTSPMARERKGTAEWTPPTRRRVRAVRDRLREVYGRPLAGPHGHPIAELVLTVLSQSTNDRNRDVAYLRLRERFPDWEAVRDAPVAEIEEAIRPGGISIVKSARIKAILEAITEQPAPHGAHGGAAGELTLDWLAQVPLDAARDYLVALPGVGRKTAACVLLFAFGLRDVPVDTHVSRVGGRLHLLREGKRHWSSSTTRCSR